MASATPALSCRLLDCRLWARESLRRTRHEAVMASPRTWRGEGVTAVTGTDEHRLEYAFRNLASTEKVLIYAARDLGKPIAAMQSHEQVLQASLARMKAAPFSDPLNGMRGAETIAKLEAQLHLLSKALYTATKAQSLLMYKAIDIVGPFGQDKDYMIPQIDELTNAINETYDQQVSALAKLPETSLKPWWDAKDPSTWIPHGWKATNILKWRRFAKLATEEGNGLIPYYGIEENQVWDPLDPLTWVPYGWKIKDAAQWKEWHDNQKEEDSDESPHAGLLTRDTEWNKVEQGVIQDAGPKEDPHKHTDSTFTEAYGAGAQRKGKFESETLKAQLKPVSPFGDGDYQKYYENKKKQSTV